MKAQTMRSVRQFHHYIGLFFAPMILLFALSGALQTFRLQEEKGYGGTPPRWIVWMAAVHKDQSTPRMRKPPEGVAKGEAANRPKPPKPASSHSTLPLKIFVALLSIGLMLSTILGIVIALNIRAMRRVSLWMLVAGTVMPLALLYF